MITYSQEPSAPNSSSSHVSHGFLSIEVAAHVVKHTYVCTYSIDLRIHVCTHDYTPDPHSRKINIDFQFDIVSVLERKTNTIGY